jgi:3-(3-hydroxy-phenyl)propionate hydroxylase
VLRPDGFIYAAADSGQPLPPPPVGLTTVPQIRSGASA